MRHPTRRMDEDDEDLGRLVVPDPEARHGWRKFVRPPAPREAARPAHRLRLAALRHFVLTRSAYGPAWSIEANRRRLAVTKAVTARLMAAQTTRVWTWVVLLDRRDPLFR